MKALRGGTQCSVQFWTLSVLEANDRNNGCNIHLQYSTKSCLQMNLFQLSTGTQNSLLSFCPDQPQKTEWLIYHLRKTQLFGTWRKIVFVPSCHSCYDVSRWSICHQLAENFQQKWFLSKNLAAMHSTLRKIIDESPKQRTVSYRRQRNSSQQTTNKGPKCLNSWKIEGSVAFEISEVLGGVLITTLWGMTELKVKNIKKGKTFVS